MRYRPAHPLLLRYCLFWSNLAPWFYSEYPFFLPTLRIIRFPTKEIFLEIKAASRYNGVILFPPMYGYFLAISLWLIVTGNLTSLDISSQ